MTTGANKNQRAQISRRKYIKTGATFAAGGLLSAAGCGGGDANLDTANAEGVLSGDKGDLENPKGLVGTGFTVLSKPTTAVNGYVFQVEVTRRTNVDCAVWLFYENTSSRVLIADKKRRSDREPRSSLFDIPSFSTVDSGKKGGVSNLPLAYLTKVKDLCDNLTIEVTTDELTPDTVNQASGRYISIGPNGTFNRASAFKVSHTRTQGLYELVDQEWLFCCDGNPASATNWDVSIRFSDLNTPSTAPRATTWVSSILEGQSYVPVAHGRALTSGQPRGVRHLLGANGDDMVLVPHSSSKSSWFMMKPLMHSHPSTVAKDYAKVVVSRQLDEYATELDISATDNEQAFDFWKTELFSLFFGKTDTDFINSLGPKAWSAIKNITTWTENQIFTQLRDALVTLDNQSNDDYLNRLLQVVPQPKQLGKIRSGSKAALSLQIKANGPIELGDLVFNGGARASLLIAQAARTAYITPSTGEVQYAYTNYHIKDSPPTKRTRFFQTTYTANDGYKLNLVAIISRPKSPTAVSGVVSFDIEVTFGLSINVKSDGKWICRLDSIVIDPLFDINLRGFTTGLVEKFAGKRLSQGIDLLTEFKAAEVPAEFAPTTSEWLAIANATGDYAKAFDFYTAADIAQTSLELVQKRGRTWALFEGSVLRFGFYNKDALDTTKPFSSGFAPIKVSYLPGAKAFTGLGFEAASPGGVAGAFIRLFAAAELYVPESGWVY